MLFSLEVELAEVNQNKNEIFLKYLCISSNGRR